MIPRKLCCSFDLKQHVETETRHAHNTLDLVMTFNSDRIEVDISVDPYVMISDHLCVASVHRLPRITALTCYKAVRTWSKVDRKEASC